MSQDRRLVGIDLGIASSHTVRVLAGDGTEICRRRCEPTVQSLKEIERAALSGAAPGTKLEIIVEPTGPAWLPVAVFFQSRGHIIYRVSSAKAADLRRFLSRHAKSNGIDADTLARLPLLDPAGLRPLELPNADHAELDRRVRVTDRLTQLASQHKTRIKSLVRQLLPMTPLTADLGSSDIAVLARTGGDPNQLLQMGQARLSRIVAQSSHNHLGAERAEEWIDAAQAAVDLYGQHPAFAPGTRAAEVRTEVELLRAVQKELAQHATSREQAYQKVDPRGLARSLPGIADVGGPALVAIIGRPGRFPDGPSFRSYSGLAPKASETGQNDRKGEPMSKAGSTLLRTTLIRAADTARHQDPLAGSHLLGADGRARRQPHQGAVCRGRPSGRAGAHSPGAGRTLRTARYRRRHRVRC